MADRLARVLRRAHVEGEDFLYRARVEMADRSYMLQEDADTIYVRVYVDGEQDPIYVENPSAEDVVFDTLQLDGTWNEDALGYNIGGLVPGRVFKQGSSRLRVEITVCNTEWSGVTFGYLVDVKGVWTPR